MNVTEKILIFIKKTLPEISNKRYVSKRLWKLGHVRKKIEFYSNNLYSRDFAI